MLEMPHEEIISFSFSKMTITLFRLLFIRWTLFNNLSLQNY